MPYGRIGQGIALASFVAAMWAACLYIAADVAPPMLLIGAAIVIFGLAWNDRGPKPEYDDYASPGQLAVAAGAVILIAAVLLALPSNLRVAEEAPEFSTVAAIDAKVDRFLKTRQTDPSVLAAATFGGFAPGSASLDCKEAATHGALESLLDRAAVAHKQRQQLVLLLIGMTDRTPLKPALRKQYESNVGLAAARVERVRACLASERPDAAAVIAAMQILRLTSGPVYSPEVSEPPAAETAKMALDRQVSALLFSLAVTTTQSPGKSASQSASKASGEATQAPRHWFRCVLLILGVGGLLALAVAIMRAPAHADTDKKEEGDKKDEMAKSNLEVKKTAAECDKIAEALAHVREMHQLFAQLRSTNFNFFVVIVGAEIAAAASLTKTHNTLLPFVAALAVALTCVIFYGIERRTVEMIGDAREELERLEVSMGVYLSRADSWRNPAVPRHRRLTHTNLYFTAFAVVYFGAIIALRLYYPG